MSGLLDGKVALVTGGASGIGRATALVFAREGALVAVADRGEAAAQATVGMINAAGGQAIAIAADVTREEDVAGMVARTLIAFGRLDCAFNNAGWEGNAVESAEISEDDWHRMIDVKLNGTWRGLKYQARQMLAQGDGGAIVNMAGSWGLVGFPRYASYCAAAHGIMGLTRAAAMEWAADGIRVNTIMPFAMTDAVEAFLAAEPERASAVVAQVPLGRVGDPETDIGRAVVFLAGPDSAYLTGATLPLDGGLAYLR